MEREWKQKDTRRTKRNRTNDKPQQKNRNQNQNKAAMKMRQQPDVTDVSRHAHEVPADRGVWAERGPKAGNPEQGQVGRMQENIVDFLL